MRRILIYGGSFNPPHLGHEKLLRAAIEFLQPALTLVVPSAVSPHKSAAAVPLAVRAEMCRTFTGCGEAVRVSEIERAGKHDKSYTLKTLRRLRKIYRDADFHLLIGSDMLLGFDRWHRYRRILQMVTLVAASRQGDDRAALEAKKQQLEKQGGRVLLMEFEPLPMSSTEVRARLARGENAEGLVSPFTASVIQKYHLYQPTTEKTK